MCLAISVVAYNSERNHARRAGASRAETQAESEVFSHG